MLTIYKDSDILNIPSVCLRKEGDSVSRNKYPEETYQKILDVSLQLFMTKGFDNTSLNDIIKELGGLTKGAIYYHFKSKEAILGAVVSQLCSTHNQAMIEIAKDPNLTGAQKLEKMTSSFIADDIQEKLVAITPNMLDNPKFLAYYIKSIYMYTIPLCIVPIVKQGVADGSIQTDYPEEVADLLIFLSDIWMNPIVFDMTSEQITRKLLLFEQIFETFGLHLLNQEVIERARRITDFAKKTDK